MRIPFISLIAGSALALGGCAYGDMGLGLGYGGGYGTYGSYGSPYYGASYGYGSPDYGGYGNYATVRLITAAMAATAATAGTAIIIIRAPAIMCTTAIAGPTR